MPTPAADPNAPTFRTTTTTQWGVRHKDGHVEHFGTTPSGTIGQFTEDHARYIARTPNDVMRRTVVTTTQTSPWHPAPTETPDPSATPAATAIVPVPPMHSCVEGRNYGGQYWHEDDYVVNLTLTGQPPTQSDVPGAADSTFATLTVENSSDITVFTHALTRADAEQILHIAATSGQLPHTTIPGLNAEYTWVLASNYDHVNLTGHLDEIAAWLRYALGLDTWNTEDTEWEY